MDQEIKKEFEDLNKVISKSFSELEQKMATKEDLNKMATKFDNLESRVAHVENQMVTKDYLDEKLLMMKGDLVVLMRGEDVKLLRLVELLKKKAIISDDEVKELLAMEPFPQFAL